MLATVRCLLLSSCGFTGQLYFSDCEGLGDHPVGGHGFFKECVPYLVVQIDQEFEIQIWKSIVFQAQPCFKNGNILVSPHEFLYDSSPQDNSFTLLHV